jgi:hypothetical protein
MANSPYVQPLHWFIKNFLGSTNLDFIAVDKGIGAVFMN